MDKESDDFSLDKEIIEAVVAAAGGEDIIGLSLGLGGTFGGILGWCWDSPWDGLGILEELVGLVDDDIGGNERHVVEEAAL